MSLYVMLLLLLLLPFRRHLLPDLFERSWNYLPIYNLKIPNHPLALLPFLNITIQTTKLTIILSDQLVYRAQVVVDRITVRSLLNILRCVLVLLLVRRRLLYLTQLQFNHNILSVYSPQCLNILFKEQAGANLIVEL